MVAAVCIYMYLCMYSLFDFNFQDFNGISDGLRCDEEFRCEMHQRVDDLRERLWAICDERKEQAEKERLGIMASGWVEDRLGLLVNYFISLMQMEIDRFQDTVRLLQDYYRGMDGRIPDEMTSEFARVPLLEVWRSNRSILWIL